ncbi:uncharacterized protein LOC115775849 [Archocentrus centrarchus]|uniref:uncharacterized protein LOC115775849 n=1 Tax=Archocentrus centrarchus TaxID=63155 RepID=UPI0011E9DCBB|nr:uncharacterized protein LOC115775849 [Archocentrus centrarchus]
MKSASVSVLLGVCVLLLSALTVSAVSLSVSPNLQQFFSGSSSVSLSCVDDGETADGWTVRSTRGNQTGECGAAEDFGRLDGSSCVLDFKTTFTANCWCETSSGQKSNDVSVSVSDKGVILEIPALPVIRGSDVTLSCRQINGDTVAAYFFMSGRLLGSGYKEHIISNVQQVNEGLYWCATDLTGPSPQSFLRVRGPPTTSVRSFIRPRHMETIPSTSTLPPPPCPTDSSSPPPPPPSSCVSSFRIVFHLLVFCPYFITTGLLLSICLDRTSAMSSGNTPAVTMGMTQLAEDNYDITVDAISECESSDYFE